MTSTDPTQLPTPPDPATPVPAEESASDEVTAAPTVEDLVGRVAELLNDATQMDLEVTGNGGRTPRIMAERASILATLAVATAIRSQQATAAETSAAVSAARAQLELLTARVALLEGGRTVLATAVVDLGSVAASEDVTVQWEQSLGDASYQVDLAVDGTPVGRDVARVMTTYVSSAVITVEAELPLADNAQLQATAWRGI